MFIISCCPIHIVIYSTLPFPTVAVHVNVFVWWCVEVTFVRTSESATGTILRGNAVEHTCHYSHEAKFHDFIGFCSFVPRPTLDFI